MVVDTSALYTVIFKEENWEVFADTLAVPGPKFLSAFSLLETKMVVVSRLGIRGNALVESLLSVAGIQIVDFTAAQAQAAYSTWKQYGKGNHPASLNMGDCASYALGACRT